MLAPIPVLEDYGVSPHHGFLPSELPLTCLPDPYYAPWESIVANLQGLLLTKRIRETVDGLTTLSTGYLRSENEWRRAYVVLVYILHGYVWGGNQPEERIPPQLTIPLLQVCHHLDLPPVATYAGVCLWNYRPVFPDEPAENLNNLTSINTFTGSLDEQWFYLVSVAIEARGGPTIPLMLRAISAARKGHSAVVTDCLHEMAQRLDEIVTLLERMYENCDPYVFYHRIRPYLAGSKNMADAGLPNGVLYDDGSGNPQYGQYGGGSNAQSSLIQFFDIVLGIEHRPTGEKKPPPQPSPSAKDPPKDGMVGAPRHGFIQEMRSYMPGPHRRFLEHVNAVANIREFVESRRSDNALCIAYDACLYMLRTMRDKHIQIVSRYIIVQSRQQSHTSSSSSSSSSAPSKTDTTAPSRPQNLANSRQNGSGGEKKNLRGTGGTALIPFLKQARDETGEPAIDAWARRLLGDAPAKSSVASLSKIGEHADGNLEVVGLSGTWAMDDFDGGICHW